MAVMDGSFTPTLLPVCQGEVDSDVCAVVRCPSGRQ